MSHHFFLSADVGEPIGVGGMLSIHSHGDAKLKEPPEQISMQLPLPLSAAAFRYCFCCMYFTMYLHGGATPPHLTK